MLTSVFEYESGMTPSLRLRDESGRYWDFVTLGWVDVPSANIYIPYDELPQGDGTSIYSVEVVVPAGALLQEAVLPSGDRIAYEEIPGSAITPVSVNTGTKVSEMLNSIIPRLPKSNLSISFVDAMQATVDVIVRRLWLKRSDLIKAELDPVAVGVGVNTFALPGDFLGFTEAPFITYNEQTRQVFPLPSNLRYTFTQNGAPKYYEITGQIVKLYPAADKIVTVQGQYYQDPPKLTGLESAIPFNRLFDPIIKDAVLQIGSQGIFIIGTPQFEVMVRSQVDQVLQGRNPKQVNFFQVPTGRQPWRGW